MKFAIYGVSRSGKDCFIAKLQRYFADNGKELYHIRGSEFLNKRSEEKYGTAFKSCGEKQKEELRRMFVDHVKSEEQKHEYVVADGHYAFYTRKNVFAKACTKYDIDCYDKFFYIDTDPQTVVQRMKNSEGDKKDTSISETEVKAWQDYEIENLTGELLAEDKELHVFTYDDDFALRYVFDCVVRGEYDSRKIARGLIGGMSLGGTCVVLADCDKTLSAEDSSSLALKFTGKSQAEAKNIFGNDRYTNYQAAMYCGFLERADPFGGSASDFVVNNITPNKELIADLNKFGSMSVVGLTAGNGKLWSKIVKKFGLDIPVLADEKYCVSKYVKYYAVKELQAKGKYVIALGDSVLDGLMLKQANKGYIVTAKGYRDNINKMLAGASISQLGYFPACYDVRCEKSVSALKSLDGSEKKAADIAASKSDSGIGGKALRAAHYRLGREIADMITGDFPADKFTVVAVMRSGLPFSMGIADALDCPVLFYDDNCPDAFIKQLGDNPQLSGSTFIICDGVINSGKTVTGLLGALSGHKCIVATNVLCDKCDPIRGVPVYASRISQRSYIGAKQSVVKSGKGPDTSDRLFDLF